MTGMRIAMWSGPRNISTAMMRSFGNRSDCFVTDEPLYACYLAGTGAPHPMREEVLASQSRDWRDVTAWLTGPIPAGRAVWYQKHMTHHLLPAMGRDWFDDLVHCFLIRDPRRVLASYAKKRDEEVRIEDVGMIQQAEIFDEVVARGGGRIPPVIDAAEVLAAPRTTLARLCAVLGIGFEPEMLAWPPGRRSTDGVWAAHWYHAVEASTGFAPPPPEPGPLAPDLESIAEACGPAYERLRAHALA